MILICWRTSVKHVTNCRAISQKLNSLIEGLNKAGLKYSTYQLSSMILKPNILWHKFRATGRNNILLWFELKSSDIGFMKLISFITTGYVQLFLNFSNSVFLFFQRYITCLKSLNVGLMKCMFWIKAVVWTFLNLISICSSMS